MPHLPPTAQACGLRLHQLGAGKATLGVRDGARRGNRCPFDQSRKPLGKSLCRPAADAVIATQPCPSIAGRGGPGRLRVQATELHQPQKASWLDQAKAHLYNVLFRVGTWGLSPACNPLWTFSPSAVFLPLIFGAGNPAESSWLTALDRPAL